jgi:hypothetical protein
MLSYLSQFNPTEQHELQTKYGKTLEELEGVVTTYNSSYWYYNTKYHASLYTNVLYLGFQISFSKDGLQSFVHIFNPQTTLSNTIGYLIGVPLALMDFGFNSSVYSCHKEAVKSVLDYAAGKTYGDTVYGAFANALINPRETAKACLFSLAHHTALLTHNLTGAFTYLVILYEPIELLSSTPLIDFLPSAHLKAAITLAIFYCGNGHYQLYSNPDYYKGLDFWKNAKKRPWLIDLVWRGQYAIPLQVFLQGIISTVCIRSFPNYFYYALHAADKLGGWMPAPLVAIIVAWHSLCVRYPSTYNHYMADQEKIEDTLQGFFGNKVNTLFNNPVDRTNFSQSLDVLLNESVHLLAINPALASKNKNKFLQDIQEWYFTKNPSQQELANKIAQFHIEVLTEQVLCQQKIGFAATADSTNLLPLLFRTIVGGYFGYSTVTPLLMVLCAEFIPMAAVGIIVGAVLMGGLLYSAQRTKATNHLVQEHLNTALGIVENQTAENSISNKARIIADTLNLSSQASRAMSTMGSGARLLGKNSLAMTATTVVVLEQLINGFLFNMNKLRNTMQANLSPRLSHTPGTLFHHPAPIVKEVSLVIPAQAVIHP